MFGDQLSGEQDEWLKEELLLEAEKTLDVPCHSTRKNKC